ncbi:MAG: FCD domain-containing protein [Gammaproteobacteria bacterium]|nr:FCD domain-containing protein [Gammaproteobacteria bacterium]
MNFKKISQQKISESIASEIEQQLVDGVIKPGERLPSERDLAHEFQVSRPSIREAIQLLKSRNLLSTRPGGGTYAREVLGDSMTGSLDDLLVDNVEIAQDMLEFRHALEGVSAFYAAKRATEADKQIIQLRFEQVCNKQEQSNAQEEAMADVDFHLAIAEASHNVVLLHVMRSLFKLLHKSVELSFGKLYLKDSGRKIIREQHKAIMDAILSGDAELAKEESYSHISYVKETLEQFSREEKRSRKSQERLEKITRELRH